MGHFARFVRYCLAAPPLSAQACKYWPSGGGPCSPTAHPARLASVRPRRDMSDNSASGEPGGPTDGPTGQPGETQPNPVQQPPPGGSAPSYGQQPQDQPPYGPAPPYGQ